jgi:hypothetical protein
VRNASFRSSSFRPSFQPRTRPYERRRDLGGHLQDHSCGSVSALAPGEVAVVGDVARRADDHWSSRDVRRCWAVKQIDRDPHDGRRTLLLLALNAGEEPLLVAGTEQDAGLHDLVWQRAYKEDPDQSAAIALWVSSTSMYRLVPTLTSLNTFIPITRARMCP